MKSLIFSSLLFCSMFVNAQLSEKITLPAPEITGGMPLMEALSKRSSAREFDATKDLSKQELSNLLWAANGFNRKQEKRTAPSANNQQELDIYVFTKHGVYRWDSKTNVLHSILAGDNRAKTGKQEFVKDAAVNLVYVADYTKMDKCVDDTDRAITTAANCGHCSQNVYLYAASKGYGAVIRGWFDKTEIAALLKLLPSQHVVLCQSVGPGK